MRQTTLTLRSFGAQAAESGAEHAADAVEQPTEAAGQKETEDGAARPDGARQDERAEPKGALEPQEPQSAAEPQEQENGEPFERLLRRAALTARWQAAQAAADRWEKEAEELKQTYPFFSLEDSMRSDKGFVSLLRAGVPVRLAFEAANLDKILGAAMRYAAGAAGKRTVQSILAGSRRVRENPALDRAAGVVKKDVGALTERDILKIIKQVSNGERVTF